MGTSTFSGTWGNNLTLEILSAWNKQDIPTNTSTVNVQVYLKMSVYGSITLPDSRTLKVTVDGKPENVGVNVTIKSNERKLIFAKDYKVAHNADGSKPAFNISAYLPINFQNYGEATATQSINLPKINRLSTSSNVSGKIGDAVAININRYSTSFTHNLKYDFKGSTGTIATGVDTSYSWTIPATFASLLPNELTGTGNLIVETMNGSTKVGETKYTLSVTIPDTAAYKPTLSSITLSDGNTATASLVSGNNFIRILSKVKVSFGASTGNNGSTISAYYAEVVGKSKSITVNGGSFDMLDFAGSATIRATVTDSRGLTSAPVDVSINVIDYFLPIVTSAKIVRSQHNPDILQVLPFVEIAPVMVGGIQKNQLKMSVSVAPYNTGIYTVDSGAATDTWSTISKMSGEPLNLGGTYDKSKTWLVKVSVSDSLMSAIPITQTISSEFVLVTKTPNGLAFGKIWERGIIDAKGDVYVDGTIYKGDKPIQHYQQTTDDGKIIRLDNVDLNTIVTDTKPIAVYANANMPIAGHGYYYLEVFQHNAGGNYVMQRATARAYANDRMFWRVRENGTWRPWNEIITNNSSAMVNTGWVNIGNSFNYKQVGDVVYLRYDFASNGVTRFSAGNMPTALTPRSMMFDITGWTTAADKQIHIQVNETGLIEWINPGAYSNNYKGQISWAI
ncbi:TPA: hypothetical protein U4W96_000150 [Streptococcus agalactiae]|uniref:DUF859 family phage minor structural protein n=1 Tax=Streptococcus agalactiae TaxID=1311 RepID=UPI000D7009B2|nr:DUF859 family phage minor structural protein [Streptococcus agalactiae]PWT25415.1 hypothetical protein CUZ34_01425 [Streptococcus agalactiae]HEN3143849.1 hypothetical protein [Streptococcus agalactiae]